MYFLSKSDVEVSLPTQPPHSGLILDFVHQARGNTWKRSKKRLITASAWIWQSHRVTTIWWCREILLGRSELAVMMLQPRNHALTQSYHLMKALLGAMLLYKHQLLYDTYDTYIYIYIYIYTPTELYDTYIYIYI